MTIYAGTSGYSYRQWKGAFYPKGLPNKHMLRYYGSQFRTVEANSTFRGLPKPSVVEAWAGEVPAEFRFAVKAPQRITHFRRLRDVGDLVADFVAVAGVLKKRLGPLFFQLPPNFKKDMPRLREFLALLPKRFRTAIEFKHPTWFDDEVFGLLRKRRVALCIADDEDNLKVPFVATANWGYLRLRRPDYGDADLKRWLKQIRKQDWQDVFVYFKHEDEAKGPQMAKRFLELAM